MLRSSLDSASWVTHHQLLLGVKLVQVGRCVYRNKLRESTKKGGLGGCESHTTLSTVARALGGSISHDCGAAIQSDPRIIGTQARPRAKC